MTNHRPAPGQAARPILSDREVEGFSREAYFAHRGRVSAPVYDPWYPTPIAPLKDGPDLVVGGDSPFTTVQQAVNAAILCRRRTRQTILIKPGVYSGVVYIPADAPPLTLLGGGSSADEVRLELALDARWFPATYTAAANPSDQFRPGDPAWPMYQACAGVPNSRPIDTPCTAVVWSQADDLQLVNLSIVNTLLDSVDAGTHQAVALRSDGDRVQIEGARIIGRQDSLFINAGEPPLPTNAQGAYPTDRIARAWINASCIEGDFDFVFGRASAVFEHCVFRSVSTRGVATAIVFAPDTLPAWPYGFLVSGCEFVGDAGLIAHRRCKLGRSWDQGAATTGYLAGRTANGQLLILDSQIGEHIDVAYPWECAATTQRPHTGNVLAARDLNDPAFNRLWEYRNRGPGA